jgi:hypothetical protein
MNTWLCMKGNIVVNVIHATEDFIKNDDWCQHNYTGYHNHGELSKTMNPAPWIGDSINDGKWNILRAVQHGPLTIDTYMKTEKKNRMLRWIVNVPHFLRCGLHSGLRVCCVFFFAFIYSLPINMNLYRRSRQIYDSINRNPVIACPMCLIFKRKRQEFKPCNCLPLGHESKV